MLKDRALSDSNERLIQILAKTPQGDPKVPTSDPHWKIERYPPVPHGRPRAEDVLFKKLGISKQELEEELRDILCMNELAADDRRRTEKVEYYGTTARELLSLLLAARPEIHSALPNLSVDTIRRWLSPPCISRKTAKSYHTLVDTRPRCPQNDARADSHKDIYSLDAKAKVPLGQLAITRHNKQKKFFTKPPKVPPHDFPTCRHRYEIVPVGISHLKFPPTHNSAPVVQASTNQPGGSYFTYQDRLGRQRVLFPRTGQLTIGLWPNHPLTKATILHQLSELEISWNKSKTPAAAFLATDRGPGYNWETSLFNFICYGDLWWNRRMDVLVISSYGPGHSAFGPIEREWSKINRMISGAYLPATLPDETQCPMCGHKEEFETNDAIRRLFDLRTSELCRFLQKPINGYPTTCRHVPSASLTNYPSSYHNDWMTNIKKDNLTGSQTNRLTHLLRHCVRHCGFLAFIKCTDRSCCSWDDKAPGLLNTIRTKFHGTIPHPRPFLPCDNLTCPHENISYNAERDVVHCAEFSFSSQQTPSYSHFSTFLQLYKLSPPACVPQVLKDPNSDISLEFCDEHRYHFPSETDKTRHWKIAHAGVPTKSFLHSQFRCTFELPSGLHSNERFDTKSQLASHKSQNEHKHKRARIDYPKGTKVDIFHSNGLWYCGIVTAVHGQLRQVRFADKDSDKIEPCDSEWRICTHSPQLQEGSKL